MDRRRKHTINTAHSIAHQRGGKCWSEEYRNVSSPLLWECSRGHIWEARFSRVLRGSWCPVCAREKVRSAPKRRLSIADMQRIAHSRGGACLSTHYDNNKAELQWKCSKGHVWQAKPLNVKAGTWCPVCNRFAKGSIEKMQQLAAAKGGKCLSTEYVNAHTKLTWQCAMGHIWEAIPDAIKRGTWCPVCWNMKRGGKT